MPGGLHSPFTTIHQRITSAVVGNKLKTLAKLFFVYQKKAAEPFISLPNRSRITRFCRTTQSQVMRIVYLICTFQDWCATEHRKKWRTFYLKKLGQHHIQKARTHTHPHKNRQLNQSNLLKMTRKKIASYLTWKSCGLLFQEILEACN